MDLATGLPPSAPASSAHSSTPVRRVRRPPRPIPARHPGPSPRLLTPPFRRHLLSPIPVTFRRHTDSAPRMTGSAHLAGRFRYRCYPPLTPGAATETNPFRFNSGWAKAPVGPAFKALAGLPATRTSAASTCIISASRSLQLESQRTACTPESWMHQRGDNVQLEADAITVALRPAFGSVSYYLASA